MKTMTLNEFKEQYSGNEIGYFYLSDENNLEYKLFSEEIKRETKLIYLLYNNEDLFLGTISLLTMKQNLDLIKRGYYKQPTFNRVNILLKEQLKMKEKIYIKVFSTTDIFTITLDLPGNTRKNINIDFKNKSIEDEEYVYDDDDNLITNFAYNRIIYGAPGTGKSYRLQKETKNIFKRKIIIEKENNENFNKKTKKNYWLVTCGEGNYAWDIFKAQNIFSVGWGSIKDILDKSDEDLRKEAQTIYRKDYFLLYLFYLSREIEVGDVIIVRKGLKKIAGYGIVNKKYFEEQVLENGRPLDDFCHNIGVEWKKNELKTLNTYKNQFSRYTIATVNPDLKKAFDEEYIGENADEKYLEKDISTVERVTFYDGYTYGQFVGTYKPVPCLVNGIEAVSYKYIPGIFMKQLINAYKNPDYNFCLIIEEINRAKADRVFGNIFQLLDRQENGQSEYRVAISDDQKKYLEAELSEYNIDILNDIVENGLYIPKNMYIWATMNSADQGVYPLDSAFKRRWNFEYIGLDDNSENFISDENNRLFILNYNGTYIKWNDFREIINNKLLENNILEDRLIAPFFIKKSSFEEVDNYLILNKNVFADKILMYLFDDILRHSRKNILFKNGINSFSQMKKEFKNNEEVFNSEIAEKIKEKNILANNL